MSDQKYHKLKIGEIKSGIQMIDRLTTGNLSHHKNYLRNLLEIYLKETEEQANGANASDSGLHLQRVSVAKHPLPRPLECWNKARELNCGDYIEWHLEKERGNAR